jgi:hypothetical protein
MWVFEQPWGCAVAITGMMHGRLQGDSLKYPGKCKKMERDPESVQFVTSIIDAQQS